MQVDQDRIDQLRALNAEQRAGLDALIAVKNIHDPAWRAALGERLEANTATVEELARLLRQSPAAEHRQGAQGDAE